MVRDLVRDVMGSSSTDAKSAHVAPLSFNSRPAIVALFLAASVMSVLVVAAQANQNKLSEIEKPASAETGTMTAQPEVTTEPVTPAAADDPNSQSINTEVKVENGQTEAKVEVNGQEVPVNPEGSTHTVISGDGSQTTVDVNIQSDNVNTNTVVGSSGSSSSFTSSVQSQTVLISP